MALPAHEFFTTSELGVILRVSHKTILRMARRGALPCHHIGRSKRFRREDVERFLAGARVVRGDAKTGPSR